MKNLYRTHIVKMNKEAIVRQLIWLLLSSSSTDFRIGSK